MNWLRFAAIFAQFIISMITIGITLDFVVYRCRRGWLKAQADLTNEILTDEKKKALAEAMTKK